jgi:Phage Tail Collar Domain
MFLIGIVMAAANARRGFAQAISSLVILPKGIAIPLQIVGSAFGNSRIDMSLEGWLLCNGATASRTIYRRLFLAIETQYGDGDGVSTFALPNMPVEYRSGRLNEGRGNLPIRSFKYVSWIDNAVRYRCG